MSVEIEAETRKLLSSAVPMAVDKLTKLAEDDRVAANVRLGAIKDILDRAGYQAVHKVEDVTGKKSDQELEAELKHLLSGLMVGTGNIN